MDPRNAPGLLIRAGKLVGAVVDHARDGGRIASPEAQEARETICRACPELDQQADKCRLCGCSFMKTKRSWASSTCPADPPKWLAV